VGYPDRWKDYSKLDIQRDALWANVVAARRFAVADDRKRVGGRTGEFWRQPPSSADAYIDFQLDQMVLPAGVLQPPFFDASANDAVNYGSFGVIIAHDLSHQIDPLGAENDVEGRPINWWTETDRQQYQQRSQCLVKQFDDYFVAPGVHHDGKRVLGESVADLIGIRVAYQALQKSMQRNPVSTLDGFTPEQQFFIAWEHIIGMEMTPETQRKWVTSDPHPTPQFRVMGTLVNTPEFQHVFACEDGTLMTRVAEQRCAVW
jgi:endothelin-converting enzyme/putative endopeptidase